MSRLALNERFEFLTLEEMVPGGLVIDLSRQSLSGVNRASSGSRVSGRERALLDLPAGSLKRFSTSEVKGSYT